MLRGLSTVLVTFVSLCFVVGGSVRQLATVPEEAYDVRQELRDVEAQKEVAVRTQVGCWINWDDLGWDDL